jgi:hypothetical protein
MKLVYIIFSVIFLAACSPGGGSAPSTQSSGPAVISPANPVGTTPSPVAAQPAVQPTQTPAPTATPAGTPAPTPTPSPTPALFSCVYQAGYIAVCTGGNLGTSLVQWQGCSGQLTDYSDFDAVSTVVNSIDQASGNGKSCITYGGDYPGTCCGMQMSGTGVMSM